MDGENNGNPYLQMDDLGKTHHLRKHPNHLLTINFRKDMLVKTFSGRVTVTVFFSEKLKLKNLVDGCLMLV